jgi:hypothetical protein
VSETSVAWDPTGRITTPCAGFILVEDSDRVEVRLLFSAIANGLEDDLLLTLQSHIALMSHEEMADPLIDISHSMTDLPRLADPRWPGWTFPLMEVESSTWVASISDARLAPYERSAIRHYRVVTLDRTLDLLTSAEVRAEWVPPQANG